MTQDILLEIGLEELPAHVVLPSMKQLQQKVEAFFVENHLSFTEIQAFSTPRRLAVIVKNVPEKQEDTQEEVKGPAKKIALDSEGKWSKAAQGFVRGQGVTTEEITFKEQKGVEYVYVTKKTTGKKTIDVLVDLKEVITSMTFPVTMHWNTFDFEYIRPIRWLVALYGDTIIPFKILDVQTGRQSRGHRFLGQDVSFENASEYVAKLKEQSVIADATVRQQMIVDQIQTIANDNNWKIDLDEDLLEEVTNLVELPTAFIGSFETKYLDVPEEVLVTSMKEHQRYFDVRTPEGKLLPHFISARNGNDYAIENVIKGNEKVLTARLEDAEFFYQEDQKLTIAACVEKLKQVTFHEKIGSLYEKMQRVSAEAQIIGKEIGLTSKELADLKRASDIYKFDLVTNMVGEFPELQGIMGEKYALMQGENEEVARAIREHYMPVSSDGNLPESNVGAVLAIADKLDSLFTFFAAGMVPSGSNDPYALRRQTYGIIRIIEEKNWHFPILNIRAQIIEELKKDPQKYGIQLEDDYRLVEDFISARIRQFLLARDVRHDVIDAIISGNHTDVSRIFDAAKVLNKHVTDESFKPSMEALTRVINLAKKATSRKEIQPELFENEEETNLYQAIQKVEASFEEKSMEENYQALISLRSLIDTYFDHTMVMSENDTIRENRLSMLARLAEMAKSIASLDELITK